MTKRNLLAPAAALAAALLLAACGGSKSTTTTTYGAEHKAGTTVATMPGSAMASDVHCAAGDPVVWVNLKSKAMHESGDPYYGKTKNGKFMCTSDAQAMGGHMAGAHNGTAMHGGKHHRRGSGGNMMNGPEPTATP